MTANIGHGLPSYSFDGNEAAELIRPLDGLADWPIGRLADWRIGGLADWRRSLQLGCKVRRMEHSEILEKPYDERRLIVVADRVPPAATSGGLPAAVGLLGAGILGGLIGGAGLFAVRTFIEASKDFRDAGEDLLPISSAVAGKLRFPPGHPRKNVIYVGHPVDAGSYIPAADFHGFLFQHKVAEAQRLVRSLGATEVSVVYVEGWDRTAAAKLGLNLPSVSGIKTEVGANLDTAKSANQQIIATMTLTPSGEPTMPTDLVWTPHEPLWQEVAAARIESGLKEFVIDVRSTDDFGVNAGLKALIDKTGLDAGGKFVKHEDTVWRLEGTFA